MAVSQPMQLKRISKLSVLLKWVFPILWFVMLAVFTIVGVMNDRTHPLAFIAPAFMALFGLFVMKKFVWDLADEVFDGGDHLLFRKGSLEQKVYLNDIVNIEHMAMSSPPRVTVLCRTPGALGTELVFTVPASFNPFAKLELVTELIERVDQARRSR